MAAPLIKDSIGYRHTVPVVLSKPSAREHLYVFLPVTTLHPQCIVSNRNQAAMHDNTLGAKHGTRSFCRNVRKQLVLYRTLPRLLTVRHVLPSSVRLPFVTGCSQSLSPFGLELLWLIASR